jgi:hypothetical protein
MDINRRVVLQGIALTSLTGLATPAWTTPFSTDAPPLFVLVNDDRAGRMFLRGAAQARHSLAAMTVSTDLTAMLDLERLFRRNAGRRIVGLLDDASGTLAVDLARSAGASVTWLGYHAAQGDFSRHRLLNIESADPWAQSFGQHLVACGNAFELITRSQHVCQPRPAAPSVSWASMLGRTLASLHSQPVTALPDPADNAAMDGQFVSFLVEA